MWLELDRTWDTFLPIDQDTLRSYVYPSLFLSFFFFFFISPFIRKKLTIFQGPSRRTQARRDGLQRTAGRRESSGGEGRGMGDS